MSTEIKQTTPIVETSSEITFTCQACERDSEFLVSDVFEAIIQTMIARAKKAGVPIPEGKPLSLVLNPHFNEKGSYTDIQAILFHDDQKMLHVVFHE